MILLILISFLFCLGLIGYYYKQKTKSLEDYVVGGRNIPWFLIAASLAANDIGAGASIGLVQSSIGGSGLFSAWYIWLMIPSYFIGSFVAPLIRKSEALTIPDFFGKKYGKVNQAISAFFMVIPNIGIIAINLIAAGALIEVLLEIPKPAALSIVLIVTLLYSYLGGIWADVVTDAIQIIAVILGFSLALFFLWQSNLNFISKIDFNVIPSQNSSLSKQQIFSLSILYIANFIVGLSTSTRLYSSESGKSARIGVLFCMPVYLIYAIVPAMLGVFLSEMGVVSSELTDIITALEGSLPTFLILLIFIGIISAALSTVDTLLIGCSAIVYNDIFRMIYKKDFPSPQYEVNFVRIILVLISILAFLIAIIGIGEIITFLLFLLGVQTSALFISFLFGHFFDTKGQENTALITILTTTLLFILLEKLEIRIWILEPFIISIIFSCLVWMLFYKIQKRRNTNRQQ